MWFFSNYVREEVKMSFGPFSFARTHTHTPRNTPDSGSRQHQCRELDCIYRLVKCIRLSASPASICVCLYILLLIATPVVYGGSQARGLMEDAAAGLGHSHSNTGIQALSATYTTACSSTRSLTHWAEPGIEPTSSWILVRFVNHWATTGTPLKSHLNGQDHNS